jgi:GTP cyclohydrolase I
VAMKMKPKRQLDFNKIKRGIELVIEGLGYTLSSEGLKDTPMRVVRFYKDWLKQSEFNWASFKVESYRNMVVVKHLPFFSLCEHHLLPFFGVGFIGYIPPEDKVNRRIVGVSKLVRIVRKCAFGLNTQESITQSVLESLNKNGIKDCAVILEAVHTCMALRGVQTGFDTTMVTSALSGVFLEDSQTRNEFLSIVSMQTLR